MYAVYNAFAFIILENYSIALKTLHFCEFCNTGNRILCLEEKEILI